MTSYSSRLAARIRETKTAALVGLDPRWDQLPDEITKPLGGLTATLAQRADGFGQFCREIIDIVAPLVPAVKPQVAFFEQLGPPGMAALHDVMSHARSKNLIVIADAKRGDIGSTATAYADAWLAGSDAGAAAFPADALTVSPYLGPDTLQPFIECAVDRSAGLYVLVRTSNPQSAAFQDRVTQDQKLFEAVADVVQALNESYRGDDSYGPVGAVVGATWPEELSALRLRMPNTLLLVPGYGSQGGSASDVAAAFDADGQGALINSSRAINFAFRSPRYSDRFPASEWREAVLAATNDMIADLAAVRSE
ncbi:MAG: orotidine-5'-phosphate decarboxylase [Planctomycetaceae bacterium]